MKIIETIKFWWAVKKYNRKLLKQAKYGNTDPYVTTKEDVDEWFKTNPFELDRESLNTHHMVPQPKLRIVNIYRNMK
jgi:hypothetical protein